MEKFIINGPTRPVEGSLNVSGAKNSCLPLMAASVLFKKKVTLKNVPFVKDVFTMIALLKSLGAKVDISEKMRTMTITNKKKHKLIVPYRLVSTMRAGVLLMGSLLSRYQKKKIKVALGGGCALGIRDTSWHLEGFKKLGAKNILKQGYVNLFAKNGLVGSEYKFPKVTVTGTENLIMASIFVKGFHILKNISIEPEVLDLINFLNKSGAKIKFVSKRTIKIEGINELIYGKHEIIGDRIEAFSYLCVAAITKGEIMLRKINPEFLAKELNILRRIGLVIKLKKNSVFLKYKKKLKNIRIKTGAFPDFATDNMPMLLAILTTAKGKSIIEETIFSNRFMCCHELERMGAVIKINNNKAIIYGQKQLSAANCISSDLRTTFSIILGAISARGVSEIQRVYHGLRGYYKIVEKLKLLGVKIRSQK